MSKPNGTDLVLYVQVSGVWTLVAGSSENSIAVKGAVIDVTSKDSAGWRELIGGERSWSVSGKGLFDSAATYGFKQLMDAFYNRSTLIVRFAFVTVGTYAYQGSCFLSALDDKGAKEGTVDFNYTLEGTGVLTPVVTT